MKCKKKKGYIQINLSLNGIRSTYYIHRLVAEAFISNPDNLPFVCHKLEILDEHGRLYNGVDNLFWGTHTDNMRDKVNKGRANNHFQTDMHPMKGKFGKYNHLSKKVNQYTESGEFIREWYSMADVKRELGYGRQGIIACCKGKQKKSRGFIWKYKKTFDYIL